MWDLCVVVSDVVVGVVVVVVFLLVLVLCFIWKCWFVVVMKLLSIMNRLLVYS